MRRDPFLLKQVCDVIGLWKMVQIDATADPKELDADRAVDGAIINAPLGIQVLAERVRQVTQI